MQLDNAAGFGRWRSLFFPIRRDDLKKFLPLFFIFVLIAFNYNLLRGYKDSMVVTASYSGAETLPFLKVWAILPSAILLTFIFTRLRNRFSREKVFYIMMSFFLIFFFVFAFFLFPARESLHPHDLADRLQAILPIGCKGLVALFRNWTFTLFYIMSELWSTAILSVLFWGFTNEITTVHEAKRYYGLLTVGGNLGSVGSALVTILFSRNFYSSWIPYGSCAWDQSVLFLSCTVILVGLLTIAIFRWLHVYVIYPSGTKQSFKVDKVKNSMRQSFSYLLKSKYLICIAFLVVAYNLATNLIEIVWKNQIKEFYPNPSEYTVYMGKVMLIMGIIATVMAVFVTNSVIRRSWTATALIPAIITLVSGAAFFFFTIADGTGVSWTVSLLGTTPLFLAITFGAIQNSVTRACKYTLFDATKEMAFIPLDEDAKLKGKAAIDGVGSRVGKSGGAVIHQGLLLVFSSIAGTAPVIGGIFLVVICVWIGSVLILGKQFDALTARPVINAEPEIPLI